MTNLLTRIFLFSLVLPTFSMQAQDIPCKELLFIRTAHHYPEDYKEELEQAQAEIIKFEPDIFITEYIAPDDMQSLKAFESNALIFPNRFKSDKQEIPEADDPQSNSLIQKLKQIRKLAQQHDQANYEYLGYLFYKELKLAPPKVKEAILEIMRENFLPEDSLQKYIRSGRSNEYQLIAFPAADALGFDKVYAMDDQSDSEAFHQNWGACADGYENQATAVFSAGIDSLEALSVEKQQMLQCLNTEAIDQIDEFVYEIPLKYSKNHKAAVIYEHYWEKRNQKMVENTLEILRETKAEKAVLIVGASHGRHMEALLKEAGIKVTKLFHDSNQCSEEPMHKLAKEVQNLMKE